MQNKNSTQNKNLKFNLKVENKAQTKRDMTFKNQSFDEAINSEEFDELQS